MDLDDVSKDDSTLSVGLRLRSRFSSVSTLLVSLRFGLRTTSVLGDLIWYRCRSLSGTGRTKVFGYLRKKRNLVTLTLNNVGSLRVNMFDTYVFLTFTNHKNNTKRDKTYKRCYVYRTIVVILVIYDKIYQVSLRGATYIKN